MREGPLDTAPIIPPARIALGIIPILVLIDILALCYPGIRPWSQPIGLALDIFGAAVLAAPDVPFIWNRTYAGKVSLGLERLDNRWDIPGYLLSPRADDIEGVYNTGFNEILNTLWLKGSVLAQSSEPRGNPFEDVEWEKIIRFTFISMESEEEEQFLMFGPEWNDEYRHENADWVRTVLNDLMSAHERRARRFGLGLLIIGFTQQLVALYISSLPNP